MRDSGSAYRDRGLLASPQVQQDTAAAQQREALVAEWVRWLRGFRWDFFATGTWSNPVASGTALQAVKDWLAPHEQSYAAIGLQEGMVNLHVHVLVGGLGRHPLTETQLRGSWRRGHMLIEGYHPRQGAVEYLCRQAFEIELVGDPKLFRR